MPKNLGLYNNNLSIPRKQDVEIIQNGLNQLTTEVNTHIDNTNNPHQVTKAQVGLNNVANVLQYSIDNPPPYPVTSVNSQTGNVNLTAENVGALPEQTGNQGQFLGFIALNTVGAVDPPISNQVVSDVLNPSDWAVEDSYVYKQIECSGMTVSSIPLIIPQYSQLSVQQQTEWNKIIYIQSFDGYCRIYSKEALTISFNISINY